MIIFRFALQTRLSSLLKTAEDLHIKGLAEVSWRSDSTQNDLNNTGHSPGAATPGVEAVLGREGEDEPPPPKQRRRGRPPLDDPPSAHDVFTPKITCITGNVRNSNLLNTITGRMPYACVGIGAVTPNLLLHFVKLVHILTIYILIECCD